MRKLVGLLIVIFIASAGQAFAQDSDQAQYVKYAQAKTNSILLKMDKYDAGIVITGVEKVQCSIPSFDDGLYFTKISVHITVNNTEYITDPGVGSGKTELAANASAIDGLITTDYIAKFLK